MQETGKVTARSNMDTLTGLIAETPSSYRWEQEPADLERSRRVRSTPRFCQVCGGPWGKELPGGPVVHHTLACPVVA